MIGKLPTMKSAKEVGQIIKDKRLENNYTQLELAQKLFVSAKTISRWECGEGYPSMYIIDDICSIFSISLNDLLGDTSDLPNNGELLILLEKKKNKTLFVGKVIIFLLMIFMLIFSFIQIDFSSDNDSACSLFNVCFISPFSWQTIIGFLLYITIIGHLGILTYDLICFIRNGKTKQKLLFINISFSLVGFIFSLLLELIISSSVHIFGFLSFLCLLICLIIEIWLLVANISLNKTDRSPIKKRYWIITGFIMLVISFGVYLSSLYLSLVILPVGNLTVLNMITFFFGMISPFVCVFFFLQFFKVNKTISIFVLIFFGAFLVVVFVLSRFDFIAFQYLIDVMTYIGIVVFPSFGFCFLNKINAYKKEEKLCLLI